jgi:outer membrane lipoprotein-sorting protein
LRSRAIIVDLVCLLVMPALCGAASHSAPAAENQSKVPAGEGVLLSHMDQVAKRVRSVSANLAYTTVTVLVNDRTTQNGMLYYRKGRHRPQVLIQFSGPQAKTILFRKGAAEIYYPKINQIQELNLEQHQNVLQQFLLLGFGTESGQLESSYDLRYLGQKKLGNQTTYLLDLTPLSKELAAHLKKVELWVSDQNWLPVQQQFFEASGDYLIARYTNMKVNHHISPSTFKIQAPGAERVKMD